MAFEFSTITFNSAKENMAYDEERVQQFRENKQAPQRYFRFYLWPQAGITYPEKRTPKINLNNVDSAPRLTGGGLVFHAPNDIVFSVIVHREDAVFGQTLELGMGNLNRHIQKALSDCAYTTTTQDQPKAQADIHFCASYPNPYELYYENEKCCGIALRRFRDVIVYQGILHLGPNETFFKEVFPERSGLFTQGLKAGHERGFAEEVQRALSREFFENYG